MSAETVVLRLEDRAEYEELERAIRADYMPRSEIEQQLVARLASLTWRLRRAAKIETTLFDMQAAVLKRQRSRKSINISSQRGMEVLRKYLSPPSEANSASEPSDELAASKSTPARPAHRKVDVASVYLRLCNIQGGILEKLGRYEISLWRQVGQTLMLLEAARSSAAAVGLRVVTTHASNPN